jgi:pyridoxine 4-dehydrogenase
MMFPRYQGEALDANLKLAQKVQGLAEAKGCTLAQIALSWVTHMSRRNGRPTIIPIPGATTPERIQENTANVALSEEDMKALDDFVKTAEVAGARYGHGLEFCDA